MKNDLVSKTSIFEGLVLPLPPNERVHQLSILFIYSLCIWFIQKVPTAGKLARSGLVLKLI
jgi:hypothetical protein